jgi:hypothetical protein
MNCTWRQAGRRRPVPVLAAAAGVLAASVRAAAAGPAGGPVDGPADGLADAAVIEETGDRIGADPATDKHQ